MNVSNEKGFHNLAQEFEQLRDELEADAEDLEKSIEDVSRHPKVCFFTANLQFSREHRNNLTSLVML